jgi:hypothetical protein
MVLALFVFYLFTIKLRFFLPIAISHQLTAISAWLQHGFVVFAIEVGRWNVPQGAEDVFLNLHQVVFNGQEDLC